MNIFPQACSKNEKATVQKRVSPVNSIGLVVLFVGLLIGCTNISAEKPSAGQLSYVTDVNGIYKIMVMNADGKPVQITSDSSSELDPTWSPDGNQVAFMNLNHLFKMNADGTNKIQLMTTPGQDSYPAWSPDGKKIAFVSTRDGKAEIYLMNPDGSDQSRLTQSDTQNSLPSWSPDSSRVAFSCARMGSGEICLIDRNGKNLTKLTQTGFATTPAWSPDGKKIAFSSLESDNNLDIYTINIDGTGLTNLTHDRGTEEFPAWSPDGKRIAFWVTNQVGIPDSAYMSEEGDNSEIFVMNSDGSNPINMTNNGFFDLTPVWKP